MEDERYTQDFDIQVTQLGQAHADRPYRFSYKNNAGEETPLYLSLDEVVGIVVERLETKPEDLRLSAESSFEDSV